MPRLVPTICTKKNFTHTSLPTIWKKKLHSLILTQLDDGSHLEFCHVGFRHCHLWCRHLDIFSQIHSKHSHSTLTLTQANSIWLKLIHYHSTWWWQPSWILPSWVLLILDSAILVFPLKLTHTCQDWFPPFAQKHFTQTSLPTICTKETSLIHWFPPFALRNVTHSFWLNLMMAAILNSSILVSAILHKTLTQTNSISFKLIHSHSSWWWQPSWILPSWIWPSWIQPF